MRKALLPMIASLALCGAATAALIATNARADQSARKPIMRAQDKPVLLALAGQDALAVVDTAAPIPESADMIPEADRARFCRDIYARKAGELAFLEAKLSLTASQQPLFDRWKQTSLDIAKQHEGDCSGRERPKPGQRPGVVDRLNREETMLKKRIADIDAEKPSLAAFYDALTQTQKEELGRAAVQRMDERVHMMMGMMGPHPGGHMVVRGPGPMGGPMGPGPMGPDPMGDAPPPPPAQ